jgi:hypothetical protein
MMNTFLSFSIEIGLTLLASILITSYLRPHLIRVLVDLCQTEDRAQFWMAFTNILLLGFPLLIALGFKPEAQTAEEAAFEIIGRLGGNMAGYLFTLVGIGFIVTFFALVAPRQKVEPR